MLTAAAKLELGPRLVLALEGGVLALGGIQETTPRNEGVVSEEDSTAIAMARAANKAIANSVRCSIVIRGTRITEHRGLQGT